MQGLGALEACGVASPPEDETDAIVRTFEREILDYLRRRPRQVDDFDGVLYWWLFHNRYIRRAELVAQALSRLVQAGWLACIEQSDGRTLFGAGQRLKAQLPDGAGPPAEDC
jgi:hypothetical protein